MAEPRHIIKANLFDAVLNECERRVNNSVESEADFWETRAEALRACKNASNPQSRAILKLLAMHPRNAKLKELCRNLQKQ